MGDIIVGIADCRISRERHSCLVTHALGSCVAVAIYDPVVRLAGLLHIMLPESSLDRDKATSHPHMFADTGIPAMFHAAYAMGADKRRLIVRLVGGAQVLDAKGLFNIGKRNHLACRKVLWAAGLMVQGEAIGGVHSRTVRFEVDTGRLSWTSGGGPIQELPVPRKEIPCPSGY